MDTLWQALLANLALVSVLVVLWDFVGEWTARLSKSLQSVLLGLIFGGGAVVSMATASIISGFVFDLRAPLLAAAALFGGVPGALVAGSGALAYRIHLGGVGMPAGVTDILITCTIGIIGYWLTRKRRKGLAIIAVFSFAVALGRLLAYLGVPADLRWMLLANTGPAIVTVTFAASFLIALVLRWHVRRRELSAENAVYRAMVRELPDCLNVKDADGRFIAANPATADFMGAGRVSNLIGKSDFDFFPEDLATKFRADEKEMLLRGEAHRIDQRAIFPDGRNGWLSTLKAPLHDDSGQLVGIITHNRDITELKRVAEAKAEFIATVSHELRTPLTSIRGSLGLIAAGVVGPVPDKAVNLIKIAHSNSERLVLLVNDILDIEKIEAERMPFTLTPMPLGPCIQQSIAASANYQEERRVTLNFTNEAGDAAADIDPVRVQQVMANLLSNAMKFSPVAGAVEVALTRQKPGWLRVAVSDRGSGIPDTFRQRIFGKFEQADASNTRDKGGTGLGLNIAKSIVERLGGTIDFRSEPGMGTTFFFDLPETNAPAETQTQKGSPLSQAS